MKLVFHPRVFAEIDSIMKYYESVASPKLADAFYEDLLASVRAAAAHPKSFSLQSGSFRRANLDRFPYNFLFRDRGNAIRILVVRHHARNPDYGTDRR